MSGSNRRPFRSTARLGVAVAVAALLLAAAVPAFAITYGTPDGNAHPFVGSIVVDIPGQGLFQACSGTLIAANVFLTAAHCYAPTMDLLAAYPGAQARVTFDPVISESATFYTGV